MGLGILIVGGIVITWALLEWWPPQWSDRINKGGWLYPRGDDDTNDEPGCYMGEKGCGTYHSFQPCPNDRSAR